MKKIKKKAILMALIMLVVGTVPSLSTAKANPSSTTCNHISCRRYWSGPSWELPCTYFEDYCPFCGTVFGRGKIPGGNPMPGSPSCPFNDIVYVGP